MNWVTSSQRTRYVKGRQAGDSRSLRLRVVLTPIGHSSRPVVDGPVLGSKGFWWMSQPDLGRWAWHS